MNMVIWALRKSGKKEENNSGLNSEHNFAENVLIIIYYSLGLHVVQVFGWVKRRNFLQGLSPVCGQMLMFALF